MKGTLFYNSNSPSRGEKKNKGGEIKSLLESKCYSEADEEKLDIS